MWAASAVAAAASAVVYGTPDLLTGEFVYDDGGTVISNPIVTGQQPWTAAAFVL